MTFDTSGVTSEREWADFRMRYLDFCLPLLLVPISSSDSMPALKFVRSVRIGLFTSAFSPIDVN